MSTFIQNMAESTSESTSFKQKFDNQLTCAVCLDQYTNPKTLPCLHSFCLKCIRRLPLDRKGDRYCVNCPTCRVEHPLPEGGADEFPNAFHINSLLELKNDLAKKEIHSISTSSKECEETSTVGDKASTCPLHNDLLRVYCETCDRLICRDCTISNEHCKKHKYDLIVECYPKHHQQIEGELRQVKSKITDIDKAITDLTNRETAVDEQGERLTMEIRQHTQQLIDIIHESERQLIQQVDTITQLKKEFLANQKEAAGRVHSQLKTCEELIEWNLREMSQEKVLMEKQAMIEQMKKASEHVDPATFVPIEEAKAKYKKYSSIEDHRMIGEIAEGETCAKAVLDAPPNCSFPKGKKCSLSLTLQSHDGSPFPVPCSAISCIAHCVNGTKETMTCNISKSWSLGKHNINFVSQRSMVYKLEVFVGGAGVPGNTMFCAVTPVKTISLKYGHYHLAVCENGDILATEHTTHSITVLDKEGRKVRSIGTKGTKAGQFKHPVGLAVTNDGHILVTDNHRLQKLTFDGVCVKSVGSCESGRGSLQFDYPRGIAVHPTTGQIFVADTDNNCVQVLNSDLTFSYIITLQDDQQFRWPHDVSLDSEGYLYVAEWGNHCITKLTTTGQYITRFGFKGSAPGQLYCPNSLTIHNNLVYVSELGNHRVSVFDTQGSFIYCFGTKGSGVGQFQSLWGVAVDKQCNLYISDNGNKRIIVY